MDGLVSFLQHPFVGFLLKLFAGIAAALFGILGLGRDVRNKDDIKLTPKGRVALIGIIVAGTLGSGSVIYDYFSAERTAADEKLKSERLLQSVQRGLYPFKGMRTDFTLYFTKDFEGLTEYKHLVRSEVMKDPQCKHSNRYCYGSGADGVYLYSIDPKSPIFPKPGSPVRTVLEHVGLYVQPFKRVQDPAAGANVFKFSPFDGFAVGVSDPQTEQWSLQYDIKSDFVALDVRDVKVPDDSLNKTGVLSLVDIIPGAMISGPTELGVNQMCDTLHLVPADCRQYIEQPLYGGMKIEVAYFKFPYPKSYTFGLQNELHCQSVPTQLIGSFFPHDIDASNFLNEVGGSTSDDDKKLLCEGMARYQNGERYDQPKELSPQSKLKRHE